MEKKKMYRLLNQTTVDDLPHIFVPSYMRPEFSTAKKVFAYFEPEAIKKVHIVVRAEQYKDYKKANQSLDIIPLPEDFSMGKSIGIRGLASTRQFIFEEAARRKYSVIIDMDDDIKLLNYMFDGLSGSGEPCSKHTVVADHEKDPFLPRKILSLATIIAREVFAEYPNVMLGNIHRQRLSMHVENAKLMYLVNSGPTPRQVTFLNVRGLKKAGINRSRRFERHGDDVGFVAEIMANGGGCFNIPCLVYDYISEKCDSVCRTPETEKELHALEYSMLQKYPMKDYLRTTFKDEEGNYMWGDIDWGKYHKFMGTKRIKRFWEEE